MSHCSKESEEKASERKKVSLFKSYRFSANPPRLIPDSNTNSTYHHGNIHVLSRSFKVRWMDAFFMDISKIHQFRMLMGAAAEMQHECVIYWKRKTWSTHKNNAVYIQLFNLPSSVNMLLKHVCKHKTLSDCDFITKGFEIWRVTKL